METKIGLGSKYPMVAVFLIALMVGLLWASSAWAPNPPPPPPPPEVECRVTGGGVDSFDNWDGTMAYGRSRNHDSGVDHYTFGGQAGAPTASQPQPYGEWTHHQQRGPSGSFVFHAGTASAPAFTEIDFVVCSDPEGCTPSGDPPSPAKQIDFGGVGTFKNIKNAPPEFDAVVPDESLHWFTVHIEDLGEPGKSGKQPRPSDLCPEEGSEGELASCDCPDFYRIRIYAGMDDTSAVIYEVSGYIRGGNLQIHRPIR
jgi:hypothetical protein